MFKILKGEKKNKKLWQFVGLIFLVGAVISGVILVKESQDIRGRACEGDNCFTDDAIGGKGDSGNGDNRLFGNLNKGGSDNQIDLGKDGGGTGCDSNSCPSPKYCQNGRCIGGGSGSGIFGKKCAGNSDCPDGRACSTSIKRCMSENNCKRYGGILKCKE